MTSSEDEQKYTVAYFPQGSAQKEFVNDLKKIFCTYKKCPGLSIMLTDCFEKSSDPFFASLSLAYNSFDYSQCKPSSLTFTVLEEFTTWIKPRMESHGHLLTNNIKQNAFSVASRQKNKTLCRLIVNTYQLNECNILFINNIRDILVNHKYKEACELVKILNLEENFNIYDFLVPLFLQDKLNIIDEFLVDNINYQIAFLTFLDSLIIEHNLSNRIAKLISELKIPDVPINTLCKLNNIKALNRYIKRLVTDFNLSKELVPNFSKRSEYKTVSYLVHKRFGEKSLSEESFRELVIDLVKDNSDLSKEFLGKLAQIGANSEAVYWCQVLNVPVTNMPNSVQQYYESITSGESAVEEEDWEELNLENFHILSLPPSAITFVSNESHLSAMLNSEYFCGIPHCRDSEKHPEKSETFHRIKKGFMAVDTSTNLYPCKEGNTGNEDNVPENPPKAQCKDLNCENVSAEVDDNTKSLNEVSALPVAANKSKSCQKTCNPMIVESTPLYNPQASGRSLLVSGGASLMSGAASLVSGGASIVSGGVSLVSGTASLVCSGASVVSGGASLVSSGISLVTGRASLVCAGASLVSGGASLVSGSSSLVSSGVSLVSGTASVVSGGVNLVSGGASLVSGAAALVAGGVSQVAVHSSWIGTTPAIEDHPQSILINGSLIPIPNNSLVGPGGNYLVALDCEWKPSVSLGKTDLSLLQLSTPNSVYILDMISLTSCQQHWDQLISSLFNNQDVLKIGFSMQTDMTYLSSYFDHDYMNFGCNLLDLADLWYKLSTDYNFNFPYSDESQENRNSLSRLVYLCLGKHLDKKERFSNWELRPLRESQIQYAALDSYCLIEIYNVLKHLCLERDIPFDDIVNEVVQNYSQKMSKKKRKPEEGPHLSGSKGKDVKVLNDVPISVDSVSFICDKMIAGLAKKLRRAGISTDTVDHKSSSDEIITKALTEGKVILVKGHSYSKITQALPPELVYKIKTCNPDNQFIEILNYFNFVIRKEDIFSRCLECNSTYMMKCTKKDVESWHLNPVREESIQISAVPAGYEEESHDDYYDDFYDDLVPTPDEPIYKPITTKYGCPIKVDVPESVLKRVNSYHLCECCGKIYWNEGRFDQILGTLNCSDPND